MTPMNEKRRAAKNVIALLKRRGIEVETINLNFNRPVITISNQTLEMMNESSLIKSSHPNEQKLIRSTRYKGCVVNWEMNDTTEAAFQLVIAFKSIFLTKALFCN